MIIPPNRRLEQMTTLNHGQHKPSISGQFVLAVTPAPAWESTWHRSPRTLRGSTAFDALAKLASQVNRAQVGILFPTGLFLLW
jgi:hypothetical protein